jgi:cytochrome c oxidase subunit 1
MPTLLRPPHHYLNEGYGIRSWLLTRDHKRIALLYLASVTVFFFIGGAGWTWPRLPAISSRTRPTTSCSRCTA